MADNVDVTPGTGATVSTEEVTTLNGGAVGAQHIQRVGLAVVTADGVAGDVNTGAGAVSTRTPRTTLASDDPAVTALQVIDDWDESDRAKVNVVVGQAGVAAGAGASGANTLRTISASDDPVAKAVTGHYETVAASQTNQALGATGAAGDYLAGVLVVPASISPGNIQIKDGAGSAVTIFTGGTSSVSNLVPFFIPLGIYSTSGAWQITTGANVSAIGVGRFTA